MADTATHMSSSKKKNSVKMKYTTFIPNDTLKVPNNGENDISLQEAFKKYRKAKQKQLKQAKRLRRRNALRKADPKVMAALRRKFIQQAKKYFGYPYAKKYWPPDSQEYRSKIFLDCCGLVRQVMRDLVDDFGFMIGPWNQAYMYDTLPNSIREEDMRPGDLVFVSATYCNPKSKKQPHNMTHVEIWLGDGPKTIGARWNNGKVQVFDSYRFAAKSYRDETYHFKSIDTWLKGICRSYCSQHSWKRRKFNPRKKSVFNIEQQQQSSNQNNQQDEAAGDDEDDITNFIIRGSSFYNDNNSLKTSTAAPNDRQKSGSAPSGSPDTELCTPDIPEDLDELLPNDGDEDISDADDSDLESTSDDEDTDLDFIDAGDADLEDDDIAKEDTATSNETVDQEDEPDSSDGPTKWGKLVDLDSRGIYLKDLMGNGDAKSPASLSDLVEEKADVTVDCIVCQTSNDTDIKANAFENDYEERQSNASDMKANIGKDMKQLSVTDLNVDASNKADAGNEGEMSSQTNLPNANQNALPNPNKVRQDQNSSCPATSTSPDISLSDVSNACSPIGKVNIQSTGSEDSITGSHSTMSTQGDNSGVF